MARQEYIALFKLLSHNHSSFLRIYNLVYTPNTEFSVLMEYGQGTLKDFIDYTLNKEYEWTDHDYIGVYVQICDQLNELKKISLCHRDIKPANIIISSDGILKLADFGLADIVLSGGVQPMSVVGTPAYWPPEIKDASSKNKSMCSIDPYQADLCSVKILVNKLMEKNKKKDTIESLLDRTPKPWSAYIEIYEKYKEEYRIEVFDSLYRGLTIEQKYEKLGFFVEYCTLGEISKWLKSKQQELKGDVEARLFYFLAAEVFRKVGDYYKAMDYYERSERIAPGLEDMQTGHLYSAMGSTKARMVCETAEERKKAFKSAEAYHKRAISIKEKVFGERSAEVAREYSCLGEVQRFQGRRQEAFDLHRRALDIFIAGDNKDNKIRDEIYNAIAVDGEALGRYDEAKYVLLENIKYLEKTKGERHPDIAKAKNHLGMIFNHLSMANEALKYLKGSLEIGQQVFPPNHMIIASIYANHGTSYYLQEDWEQALGFFNQSLEILSRVSKKIPHYFLLECYVEDVRVQQGVYETAEQKYGNIIKNFELIGSENFSLIGVVWHRFGNFYKKIGRYEDAFENYEMSIECFKKISKMHPKIRILKEKWENYMY